ncbi:DedA family protein [Gulosibacter bifidus]|uniref:DedA family protein n=1 Tax=Gulosibacter bifidus TaxID=272239 RepID=A0ABW5RFU1_9MICO|nr:DedA family protein [Gulosibacter bifidus]
MMNVTLLMTQAAPAASESFGAIGDWAVSVMNWLGAIGVGLLVLLENLFPPIPSEVILPLAGFTSGLPGSGFTWVEALIWATVGSTVGAYALYGLGAALGHDRTVRLLAALPLVDRKDIEKTIAWFNKNGYWTVFFGRMLPIFRSLISIPAGVEKMQWWKFGLLTFAGSAIWNTIFVYGGYMLGSNWEAIINVADWLKYLVIGVVAIVGIWYIVHKLRQSAKKRKGGVNADLQDPLPQDHPDLNPQLRDGDNA